MLELYVGGYAQGKLEYVRGKSRKPLFVIDCGNTGLPFPEVPEGQIPVLNHFHLLVKNQVARKEMTEEQIRQLPEKYPDCVIVSDEVGNGIVPMEKGQREYRETLGRILIELAKKADRVERVVCGLGQRIK